MSIYGPEEFITRTGKKVTLRHCEAKDIDTFLIFQQKAAGETTHTLQVVGRVPERLKVEAAWNISIQDSRELRIGAFVEDRLIAQLSFHPESKPLHPWTQHTGRFGMIILQEFWGEGIGKRLLTIMEMHALSIGVSRIEAMVREKNERGVKLYTGMGYQIEGTRRQAVIIAGETQNEFFIAKILEAGKSR